MLLYLHIISLTAEQIAESSILISGEALIPMPQTNRLQGSLHLYFASKLSY